MAANDLQTILVDQNIARENAKNLIEAFGAPFEEAGKILTDYKEIIVTEEDQFDLMNTARNKRLALKNVRIEVEKKRKELKEDSLKVGRAVDSVARFVRETIEPAEKYLEQQEKFAELRQAERATALKAKRVEQLMQYTKDLSVYNLDHMTEEQFNTLVNTLKAQQGANIAEQKRILDEAEAKSKAEREDQERIRIENAKLKKEADEREAKALEERRKAEAEAAKAQETHEAEQRAAQAKLDEERKKREAVEAEQRAALQKIETERQVAEESKRQALLAPDKDKLLTLAISLETIELPALASKDAQAVLNQVEGLLSKVSTYIRKNVKGL